MLARLCSSSRFTPLTFTCLLGLSALGCAGAASADAFADHLAVANAAEIQAARQVLKATAFDDTRNMANRMIEDHTALAQQLAALAEQLHIDLPDDASIQAQAAKLQTPLSKGQNVDAAYATAQIHAHEAALSLFEDEAQNATVPELKTFAETNLPLIRHHLQMATRLLKTHRK